MKALIIDCTLKPSPETSNTEALAKVVADKLREEGVAVEEVRAVDKSILPGVESDMGEGDEWPPIREAILDAEILAIATPTWMARPAGVTQRVLERMDAMISEAMEALIDIGFTIPAQAWTYWNRGPGPGKSYLEDDSGHEWSRTTGETAAQDLVAGAEALAASPLPVPVSG